VVAYRMLQSDVNDLVCKLLPKERDVVRIRYGLEDGEAKTLVEVARTMSSSVSSVWQLEAKAIKKLRIIANEELPSWA